MIGVYIILSQSTYRTSIFHTSPLAFSHSSKLRLLHSICERAKLSCKSTSVSPKFSITTNTEKGQTYHVTPQILLLHALEPLQIRHDALTSIPDVALCDANRLFELPQTLLRLP